MILPDFLKKSIFAFLLLYSFYSLISTFMSIHSNVIQKDSEYQAKILGLKDEKAKLEDKLKVINSDEFVEKEARTRLNMKKDGEEVYLVSANNSPKIDPIVYTDSGEKPLKKLSNFERWMEIIF